MSFGRMLLRVAQVRAPLLTVPEVAQILRVPLARAYELARLGLLPGKVQIGRQIRFDGTAIEQFLRSGGKSLELHQ